MIQPLHAASPTARNPATLALLAALWIASACNWPLWRALLALPEMQTPRGALFMVAFGLMIAALTTALLSLAAWRHTIKPAIAGFLLAAALGAHFMGTYGVVIDPTMMVNVLHTDARETADLLSPRLLAGVLLLAALPLVLLWRIPLRPTSIAAQAGRNGVTLIASLVVLVALLALSFADLSSTMRSHKSLRYMINPVNSFFALGHVAFAANAMPRGPPAVIGVGATPLPRPPGAKPPLLMLVVGETARSDHFSLNGYPRPTNAATAQLGVISFRNVTSCGTNTAASLPCMFSHLGREAYGQRSAEYGLCERIPNAFARDAPASSPHADGLCKDGECLDEALLTGLDARLAAMPAEQRERGVVLVLHQMGSHGPAYYKRSPAQRKPFLPECTTHVLQQCEQQQLINAYDNSIAYTDQVLAACIQWLARQASTHDPALLYVSDHGESLGENNLYLHGLPYDVAPREQTHVPMLLWWPEHSAAATAQAACLRARLDVPLTHDHLFHSALGLVGVRSAEYNAALDGFLPCRPK
jgi:lipid A ethanolaminephosphotransferase